MSADKDLIRILNQFKRIDAEMSGKTAQKVFKEETVRNKEKPKQAESFGFIKDLKKDK